jgi:hypothetical protein
MAAYRIMLGSAVVWSGVMYPNNNPIPSEAEQDQINAKVERFNGTKSDLRLYEKDGGDWELIDTWRWYF